MDRMRKFNAMTSNNIPSRQERIYRSVLFIDLPMHWRLTFSVALWLVESSTREHLSALDVYGPDGRYLLIFASFVVKALPRKLYNQKKTGKSFSQGQSEHEVFSLRRFFNPVR